MIHVDKRGLKHCLRFLPDKVYIQLYYFAKYRKLCNISNPRTYNEKIQWLKLHDRNKLYPTIVDKVKVKDYVGKKIGFHHIIPTIATWRKAEDIDFDSLPDSFVLKTNHNSGDIVICKDKSSFNKQQAIMKLKQSLKENFYENGREWPYKEVERLILCEKYLVDTRTNELRDYKFFCFNGSVKLFKIDFDRSYDHHANYYDREGAMLPFGEVACPPKLDNKIEVPDEIHEMIKLAERLAEGFPLIRIDFYLADGAIYFGEMTLYPASGFGKLTSPEWEERLGEWIQLPQLKTESIC